MKRLLIIVIAIGTATVLCHGGGSIIRKQRGTFSIPPPYTNFPWDVSRTDLVLTYLFNNTNNPTDDDSFVGINVGNVTGADWVAGTSTTESAYYDFPGASDKIVMTNGLLVGTQSMFVAVWTRRIPGSGFDPFVYMRNEAGGFLILRTLSTSAEFILDDGTNRVTQSLTGFTLRDSTWHLLTGVLNRETQRTTGFLDLHETGGAKKSTASLGSLQTFTNTWIGTIADGSTVADGPIDEPRVYVGTITTGSEVEELFKNTCVGKGWSEYEKKYWTNIVNTLAVLSLNFENDFAADTSAKGTNRNHGTKGAGAAEPAFQSDGTNGWMAFDGGDTITIANESNFDLDWSNDWTIAAWVNADAAITGSVMYVYDKDSTNETEFSALSLLFPSTNLYCILNDDEGSESSAYVTEGFSADRWYHLIWVNDGSVSGTNPVGKFTVYTNGVSAGLTEDTADALTTITNDGLPSIGLEEEGLGSFGFQGNIDEVKIWSYSLSAGDATNLFNESNAKFGKSDI